MKTFRKLCKRFEKIHNGFTAYFDDIESHRGYYRVYIVDCNRLGAWYTFASCAEFRAWMDGVILD